MEVTFFENPVEKKSVKTKMWPAEYAGQVIWEDAHHKPTCSKKTRQIFTNIAVCVLILMYLKFLVWITHMKIESDYIAHPPGSECDSMME